MSALPKRYFTLDEYLKLEETTDCRSQFVAGEVFAMAGAEPWHVEIVGNINGELRGAFRDKPCKTYSADMRVRVETGDLWTYPDVVALCGKPHFDPSARPRTLLNPQVIFEVLSPSTEAFDRGDKFSRYRRIQSLTDYVLVDSEQVRVEHYVRQGAAWMLTEHTQLGERVSLRSLECELPLKEIYYGVEFPTDSQGA